MTASPYRPRVMWTDAERQFIITTHATLSAVEQAAALGRFIASGCGILRFKCDIIQMPGGAANTPGAANLYRRSAMSTIASLRFYVYVLARPDGTPFYVGKGSGRRVFEHETEARSGHRCHKCSVIRKIWKTGGELQRYIIFETDDEQEAYSHEQEQIALYGLASLTNLNAGGEGSISPKQEIRDRIRAGQIASWDDPEQRSKRTAINRKAAATPESRTRHRDASIARYANPQERVKTSTALKAALTDAEIRAKRSAIAKARYSNPEERARQSAARKAYFANPEARTKQSAAVAAGWIGRKARATEGDS